MAGGTSGCSVGAVSRVACQWWLILGGFELLVAAEALERHSFDCAVFIVALLFGQYYYDLLQLFLEKGKSFLHFSFLGLIQHRLANQMNSLVDLGSLLLKDFLAQASLQAFLHIFAQLFKIILKSLNDFLINFPLFDLAEAVDDFVDPRLFFLMLSSEDTHLFINDLMSIG